MAENSHYVTRRYYGSGKWNNVLCSIAYLIPTLGAGETHSSLTTRQEKDNFL